MAWNMTAAAAPVAPSRQKTMQEIMDEELAQQMYEEECRGLEHDINPERQNNVFAHMAPSAQFEDTRANWLNAETANLEDKEPSTDTDSSIPTAKTDLRLGSSPKKKSSSTLPRPVDDFAKTHSSFREAMRRQHKSDKKGLSGRVEAATHATREGVLDERTERLMQKLINREELDEVHGIVQTGKEAHVFHAVGTDPDTFAETHFAVKIFKTTLNEFSNRHEYVSGDHRFQPNFHKHSNRQQLHTWTEKEFKNLHRAIQAKIRAPLPKVFKEHVLIMEFIGVEGFPAPPLKDVSFETKQEMASAYVQILKSVRELYQTARLVHGDLSEYNVLYLDSKCWLIDFGQAVTTTHPEAETLLARDMDNIRQFFLKRGFEASDEDDLTVLSREEEVAYVTTEDDALEMIQSASMQTLVHEAQVGRSDVQDTE